MCIIVDACVKDAILDPSKHPAAQAVHDWLEKDGKFVFGGSKYKKEFLNGVRIRSFVLNRWRAGMAISVPCEAVDAEEDRLNRARSCESNDSHIIALARVSGARVLYSLDAKSRLHRDFREKKLIDNPRGSVFKDPRHSHLLGHCSACQRAILKQNPIDRLFD